MKQRFLDFTGPALRDAGIRVAALNAEERESGWGASALGYVKEYACYHTEFTGEDVRLYAEQKGFTEPPHKRAWGAVLLAAARTRVIQKIGTRQVTNPRAHAAIATLWRAL